MSLTPVQIRRLSTILQERRVRGGGTQDLRASVIGWLAGWLHTCLAVSMESTPMSRLMKLTPLEESDGCFEGWLE